MKKIGVILGVLVAVLALLSLAGYLIAGRLVDWGTGLVLRSLDGAELVEGVSVDSASCASAAVSGPMSATWREFQMRLDVAAGEAPDLEGGRWLVRAERIRLHWRGMFSGTLDCKLHDLVVERVQSEGAAASDEGAGHPRVDELRIVCERAAVRKSIPALSPTGLRSAVAAGVRDARRWLNGESARNRIDVAGVLQFRMADRPLVLGFEALELDGERRLVADPADIRRAAAAFGDELTPSEVELLARHPLRIPQLLAARRRAESLASAHYGESRKADAHRHIVWSWLLCERFGTEFAKAVTDAHEVGSSNTAAESERDRANNRLGRSYWKHDLPFQALKGKVDSDPAVSL